MASPYITLVNKDNFEDEILKADKMVLIDFYADWCGPCKGMTPALEKFAEENKDTVKVVKVDVDASPEIAQAFGVRAMPTLVTMKDGKGVLGTRGAQSKQGLEELLEKSFQTVDPNYIQNKGNSPSKPPKP